MIKLCTIDEIRAAEDQAIRSGRSVDDLMLAAGHGFARSILFDQPDRGSESATALFLVGPGNNGGDGLIAAAFLADRGWNCLIWGYGRRDIDSAPVSSDQADRLRWVETGDGLEQAFVESDLIVDAVYGIGGRGTLPTDLVAVFERARRERIERCVPLWALDVPSGVDAVSGAVAEGAFRADVTVMLGLPKIGLYRSPGMRWSGEMRLIDIGLSSPDAGAGDPLLLTARTVRNWLPRREADAHKSQVGWLLVVGGSPNYHGAPRLSAEAAMRSGAGLVSLAVPRSLVNPISTALPEVTFTPLPEAEFGDAGARMAQIVRSAMPRYRALLIGPGLGQDAPVDDFLTNLFGSPGRSQQIGFAAIDRNEYAEERFDATAVIDADGLNWLAGQPDWHDRLSEANLVLTPHPGELARLTGADAGEIVANPWDAALRAAERFGQVVVLKQSHTVVATPDGSLFVSPQALPGLASAGTGDVLGGIIAALLAQGLSPREAACAGVFIGAEAGLRATGRVGTLSLVASDLIGTIPAVLQHLYDARM